MIVGNGLISKIFSPLDTEDLLIFCSGVSNSTCQDLEEFKREKLLLSESIVSHSKKKMVYFGTCDVYDTSKNSPYLSHKIEMENLVKEKTNNWLIFRLPQVIGKGNKNNLIFFLTERIKNHQHFECYPYLERNLIRKEDLRILFEKYISSQNSIINLANPINIKVGEIVRIIENSLQRKAVMTEFNGTNKFQIPLEKNFPIEFFTENYYSKGISEFIQECFTTNNSNPKGDKIFR